MTGSQDGLVDESLQGQDENPQKRGITGIPVIRARTFGIKKPFILQRSDGENSEPAGSLYIAKRPETGSLRPRFAVC